MRWLPTAHINRMWSSATPAAFSSETTHGAIAHTGVPRVMSSKVTTALFRPAAISRKGPVPMVFFNSWAICCGVSAGAL